jgi:hypothetical protein
MSHASATRDAADDADPAPEPGLIWPWLKEQPVPPLGPPFTLARSREQARRIERLLASCCEAVLPAGPLRRHRLGLGRAGPAPLEFVVIPRHAPLDEDHGAPVRDLLRAWVERWLVRGQFFMPGTATRPGQRRYHLLGPAGELLLWVAGRDNAGSLQLWRTGPRAHTDWLCERARQRRACWLPDAGLHDGLRRWGACEAEIYAALGLRFVPPELRRPGAGERGLYDLEAPDDLEAPPARPPSP